MPTQQGLVPRVVAGRYELRERLGGGGMGDVYAATDHRLLRPVAVKLVRPDLARDPTTRERFELEARAAARLSHPNIVTVFDSGDDGGTPFLVMERLPGRTFAREIADGPVDVPRTVDVTRAVLSALAAAHAAGIIHRDVKPGNVLLTAGGMPKVADFGIAKMADPAETVDATATLSRELFATPAYLAPERLSGAPASPQSDVYSVGVMLCEALTGTRPVMGAEVQLPRTVPPSVRDAVVRATAPDPARRYASADAMSAALDAVQDTATAEGERTVVMEPEAATRVLPFAPRAEPAVRARRPPRRGLLAILFGLLVAATVVVGIVVANSGSDRPPTVQVPETSAPAAPAAPTQPAAGSPLPAALDHAIDQLENSVSQ